MAVAELGAQTNALPRPNSAIGSRICHTCESGVIVWTSQTNETSRATKPIVSRIRGCTRSVSPPTYRANAIVTSAIGTSRKAASVGVMPRTSCA